MIILIIRNITIEFFYSTAFFLQYFNYSHINYMILSKILSLFNFKKIVYAKAYIKIIPACINIFIN